MESKKKIIASENTNRKSQAGTVPLILSWVFGAAAVLYSYVVACERGRLEGRNRFYSVVAAWDGSNAELAESSLHSELANNLLVRCFLLLFFSFFREAVLNLHVLVVEVL